MKKKIARSKATDDIRPEYDFRGGVRGKYAERYPQMSRAKVRLLRNTTDVDTMRPHYDFSKGIRGGHMMRHGANPQIAFLEPDVATAFPTSKAVNKALRSLMRKKPTRKARTRGA